MMKESTPLDFDMNYLHGLEDGLLIARENVMSQLRSPEKLPTAEQQVQLVFDFYRQQVDKKRVLALTAFVDE